MDYMMRATVPRVSHRVVMPVGSLPRHSCIFEVLPHPASIVPRLPTPGRQINETAISGESVFKLRARGRTSVNW